MYRLYYYPGNASLAPHMLLRELGVPHELALVDRSRDAQNSADYLKLNPHGRIPTLIDGELVLYEAAAICLHLTDRHAEAGLAPALGAPQRAHFYKWLIHLTNTLQPELMVYFYPERHSDDPAHAPALKAKAEARLAAMYDRIDAALADGPYLLGQQFSAADLYLLMLGRWGRMHARPPRDLPRLSRHLARVFDRPAVQAAFRIEGLPPPYF